MRRGWRVPAALAIAALLLIVLPVAAYAEKTVGISQATFDFSVAAGQKVSGELYVINDGDEPLTVMVYAADQVVDESGDITYVTPGRDDKGSLTSPASWVQLRLPAETKTVGNTPYLEMDPGEQVLVQFDVAVPTQAPPGDNQILLFFEMFDLEQALSGTGSVIGGRVGSRISVRVQGDLVEKISVTSFAVPGFVIGDQFDYGVTIANEGNIDKLIDAWLLVLDRNESELSRSDVATQTTVYAGTSLDRSGGVDSRGLIGPRTVRMLVEYDQEAADGISTPGEITEDRTVWFVPWWLFIGSVAALGALAVWLSWRQSVRSSKKKAERRRAERLARRGQPADSAADEGLELNGGPPVEGG